MTRTSAVYTRHAQQNFDGNILKNNLSQRVADIVVRVQRGGGVFPIRQVYDPHPISVYLGYCVLAFFATRVLCYDAHVSTKPLSSRKCDEKTEWSFQ